MERSSLFVNEGTAYPIPAYPSPSKKEALSGETVYELTKRIFDIVCSAVALVILSPLFLVVGLLIKAEDGGPVIHTRICLGKDSRKYKMYKFRSMKLGADHLEKWFSPEQMEQYKREVKVLNDPRITKCGAVLRKLSIDELPQLVCILKSDMSMVGPRPMTERESEHFGSQKEKILSVKPGLTGYWQVNGRSDCTYESGRRQQLEAYYVAHRSAWMDAKIFLKTFKVVIFGRGAR